MSQENVELVRQANAAFNVHDLEAWRCLIDPEVEMIDHMGALGERRCLAGKCYGVRWRGGSRSFPDFRAGTREFIDAGDRIVCVTDWRGTASASGVVVHQPAAEVYNVRGGKLVRIEMGFPTRAEALQAVGMGGATRHQ